MNRKASARDVILVAILLFIAAIVFFSANFISHTFTDSLKTVAVVNDSSATVSTLDSLSAQSDRFDIIGLGLFIGLFLFILITGWLVGGHAIFMGVYFVFILIAVVLSMVLANTWDDVANASIFGTTINNLPIMNHLLSYLPLYISIIGVIGLAVMFARTAFVNNQGGGGYY